MTGEKESAVEAYFVAEVERRGGMTLKINVSGQNFWPDRLAVLPRWGLLLVELKRPKTGRLSEGQGELIARLHDRDARVFLLWNRNMIDQAMLVYDAQEV